jgi:hypothetical protein
MITSIHSKAGERGRKDVTTMKRIVEDQKCVAKLMRFRRIALVKKPEPVDHPHRDISSDRRERMRTIRGITLYTVYQVPDYV